MSRPGRPAQGHLRRHRRQTTAASGVVGLFAVGVRLYAVSTESETPRVLLAKTGAFVCFVLCGLAVIYGIYLIIPAFRK